MEKDVAPTLRRYRRDIVEDWFQRVSERPTAKGLSREAILNNFPGVIDEIIAALGRPHPRGAVIEIPRDVAEEHGRSRAELGYDLSELGEEYNSLREAFLGTLEAHGVGLENDVAGALHGAVDQAHRAGVEKYIEVREARVRKTQSDFLARVTHDFRTPLTSVLAGLGMLERQLPAERSEAMTKNLDRIKRSAHRLLLLVEGQLATEQALSGVLETKLEAVEVKAVAEDVAELLSSRAEAKGIALRLDVPPGLCACADRMLLVQILQNLADNALKYTEAGSVSICARRAGERVRIEVRDTGRGISHEVLPRVFEMYSRSENRSEGHGVGLAVVKASVSALHGTIDLASDEGRGTTATVMLPLALGRSDQAWRDPGAEPRP